MEMIRKENINIDTLLWRLLDRQLFPWKNIKISIYESILDNSRSETEETINRSKQLDNINASSVIEKIKGRAESWDYTKLLDHLWLLEIPHLRIFQRA